MRSVVVLALLCLVVGVVVAQLPPTAAVPDVPPDSGSRPVAVELWFFLDDFLASNDPFLSPYTQRYGLDKMARDLDFNPGRLFMDKPWELRYDQTNDRNWAVVTIRVEPMESPFMQFAVFGDSLSDNGNRWRATGFIFPPSPPYFFGTFSNGPAYPTVLQSLMRTPDEGYYNRAFGGAESSVIVQQVSTFVNEFMVNPYMLFLINGGANDVANCLANSTACPDPTVIIPGIAANIETAARTLLNNNARYVYISSMPNLGRTPLIRLPNNFNATIVAQVSGLVAALNGAIAARVGLLQADFPSATVQLVVLSDLEAAVALDPLSYGITNDTHPAVQPCCFPDGVPLPLTVYPVDDPSGYLYWDDIHPTALVHQLFAGLFRDYIFAAGNAPPPEPTAQEVAFQLSRAVRRPPPPCEGCSEEERRAEWAVRLDRMRLRRVIVVRNSAAQIALSLTLLIAAVFALL